MEVPKPEANGSPAPCLPVTSSSTILNSPMLKAAATLGLQAQKGQSGSNSSAMSAAIASLMAPLLQRSLVATGTPASPLTSGTSKPPTTAVSSATSILAALTSSTHHTPSPATPLATPSTVTVKKEQEEEGEEEASGTEPAPQTPAHPLSTHGTPQGGYGAGKPKAFMDLMAEEAPSVTPAKKQSTSAKKSSKGQSTKSKTSPATEVPTRSSQRNVKRPRTYDEEIEELELLAKTVRKSKNQKSIKSSQKLTSRPRLANAMKNVDRWRPTDDIMLISAVQQTNDLMAVYLGVKFSCRFTQREIEERWYALLYDPHISKTAVEAMKALHPGVVTMALNNALWSQEEEAVLAKIPSTDPGHLESFQKLLADNPCVFHACRSPTSLHHHWVLMGHYGLLNNQKVDPIPPGDNVSTFMDAEDQVIDGDLSRPRDVQEESLHQEMVAADRHCKQEILKLEKELPKWRTALDAGNSPEFGSDVLAILKGKVAEFLMTTRSVTLGRKSAISEADFDLSLEGPAFKVSRKQATITLTNDGEFEIMNEGKRPLYLDGKPIVAGKTSKLHHNQILEVASMSFLVLLNFKLVQSVCL